MEREYLLVYFTGAQDQVEIVRLTKAQIIETTKDWSRFEYAVFDGTCVKDFEDKLNPDSPLWNKPQNS